MECTKIGTISYKNGLAWAVVFCANANSGLPPCVASFGRIWNSLDKKRSNFQQYHIAQDSCHIKSSRNMENKELLYGYLVNNFKNKNFSEYTCENITNDHFNGER